MLWSKPSILLVYSPERFGWSLMDDKNLSSFLLNESIDDCGFSLSIQGNSFNSFGRQLNNYFLDPHILMKDNEKTRIVYFWSTSRQQLVQANSAINFLFYIVRVYLIACA